MEDLQEIATSELVDELLSRGYYCAKDTHEGAIETFREFVQDRLSVDRILDNIDDDDIVEYLKGIDYLIFEDEYDAVTKLSDNLYPNGVWGASLYRDDCIELLDEIVRKNGWDFVYALLEPHKTI